MEFFRSLLHVGWNVVTVILGRPICNLKTCCFSFTPLFGTCVHLLIVFFQFLIVCQTAFQVRVIWYAWTTFFTFGIYNLEPCKSEHKHSPTTHKLSTTYQQARTLEATSYLNCHQVRQSRWVLHFCGCTFYIPEELSISASMASVHHIRTVVEFMDSLLPALIYIFDSLMIQPDFTVFHWVFLREKKFRYCLCSSNEPALQVMRDCWILLQHSVAATSLDNTRPDARKSQRNGKASRK